MIDISNEDLVKRISVLFPIISHSQAEHCGYQHIVFFADNNILIRLLNASKSSYANVFINVNLDIDNKIFYCMTFSHDNTSNFIEEIAK